jgi:L-rhamnose isomerase
LLHVSRPVRWDSDHVVLWDEETRQIMREVVHADALNRVYLATDYFDASINRIMAWVVGLRSARKALLSALLEPVARLRALEQAGDSSARLALSQEVLCLNFGAVWDELCRRYNVPQGAEYISEIKAYEKDVLSKRS